MATKTVSATNYRAHRATRSSNTASFASNAFPSNTPGFLPVGWNETTTYKCRFGMFFDIDFSDVSTISAATLTATYYEPSPNDQVNQTCTASRAVWFNRATADYDTANWDLATSIHSASTPTHGTANLTSTTTDGDTISVDVLALVNYWKANSGSNLGCYVRMGVDTSGTYAPATTTPSTNMPAASFYEDFELTITYTATATAPLAPTLVSGQTTDGITVGSTSTIKTFDAGTTSTCNLRFSFNNANDVADLGDYCQQYTIQVFTNSSFSGSAVFEDVKVTTGNPTGTISYSMDFSKLPKDTDLYWRVKTADSNPGTYGPYSSLTSGSGSSQKIAKFRIQASVIQPPPPGGGGGNPNYTSVSTFARNKFRVEFYPMQDTVTSGLEISKADDSPKTPTPSFNPYPKVNGDGKWTPCAIIHDAKSIGVAHKVNSAGVFFMTLPSNHLQISKIEPLRTFWRACRWDEKAGYFIVIGEGLVTETSSSPNETIVYGTDKLGMLEREVVPIDRTMLGAYYTFEDYRLDQLHDYLLPSGTLTESVVTKAITNRKCDAGITRGSVVTLTTSTTHGLTTGGTVEVAGIDNKELNGVFVVEQTPTTTTFTYRIPNKNLAIPTAAVSPNGTLTIATFRRNAFEPFQQSRRIYAGTPDTAAPNGDVSNSPSTSTYRTVTETRDILCDGKSYLKALADMADILMSGTTDVVIIENPNIGLPADNPSALYLGIQYRHLKAADIPSPKFMLHYGSVVRNFRYEPFQSKIASRAQVVNTTYDGNLSSSASFGVKTAINYSIYDNYGLIEVFERLEDERNDLQFAANMLYNKYPNQVREFNLQVETSRITPFTGYKVGDLIQIALSRRNVEVVDKFAVTAQEWVGNEDGSETLNFSFSPQQRASFKVTPA